uniref:Uncharacterized protein n=1 Tax=Rhizophora mucronata TaxID=61149 RepID=A0A2P2P5J3_RHIMU
MPIGINHTVIGLKGSIKQTVHYHIGSNVKFSYNYCKVSAYSGIF